MPYADAHSDRIVTLHFIHPDDDDSPFPRPSNALREPDGLLALGGNLSPTRLLIAYRQGVFPWFGEDQPILWWSPDPRTVFFPGQLRITRSLRKTLRRQTFELRLDTAFEQVMRACAEPRKDHMGTWISEDMIQAYVTLHKLGFAHSAEAWLDGELVGGLYGVALGRVFFGESMFSRVTDASKVAFTQFAAQLHAWGFKLIDGQVHNAHLNRLGAVEIPREAFLAYLDQYADDQQRHGLWAFDNPLPDPLAWPTPQ